MTTPERPPPTWPMDCAVTTRVHPPPRHGGGDAAVATRAAVEPRPVQGDWRPVGGSALRHPARPPSSGRHITSGRRLGSVTPLAAPVLGDVASPRPTFSVTSPL